MTQVVASQRGSAYVTHDGGATTLFTASYPCRVMLNILAGSLDSSASTSLAFMLYGVTSVGGVNVYNLLSPGTVNSGNVSFPILDHFPGQRDGGDTVWGLSNIPFGTAANNTFAGANAANVYMNSSNNYALYNRQFWMMPSETLYLRTYWGNNTGYRYWNFTTISEY